MNGPLSGPNVREAQRLRREHVSWVVVSRLTERPGTTAADILTATDKGHLGFPSDSYLNSVLRELCDQGKVRREHRGWRGSHYYPGGEA